MPRLLDHLVARLPALPFGCVVGEPTRMRLANGHKGKAGYVCTVTGLASHSALNHLGVNAIEIAARIIAELRRLNDEFRLAGPLQGEFQPPHCTVSTGVIAGGSALNIVPDRCRFEFEFRPLPGQDPDELFARIRDWAETHAACARCSAVSPATGIEWQELMSYPGLGGTGTAPIEQVCSRLAGPAATDQARVRDRGRPFRRPRHPGRGVRSRRDRRRAQGRRVCRAGPARALRAASCAS